MSTCFLFYWLRWLGIRVKIQTVGQNIPLLIAIILARAFYVSDPVLNTAPELLFNPHNHHVRIEKTDVAETELPQQ